MTSTSACRFHGVDTTMPTSRRACLRTALPVQASDERTGTGLGLKVGGLGRHEVAVVGDGHELGDRRGMHDEAHPVVGVAPADQGGEAGGSGM